MASIHEGVSGLYRAGAVDRKTMREFDALCLEPILKMTLQMIRVLRTRKKSSQTVFAAYLNGPPSLVSNWERGEKHPQGGLTQLLPLLDEKSLEAVA